MLTYFLNILNTIPLFNSRNSLEISYVALKIKVTQVKSGIGRPQTQRRVLAGLGLRKLHKPVVVSDSAAIRGMIRKVSHLVVIEPAE